MKQFSLIFEGMDVKKLGDIIEFLNFQKYRSFRETVVQNSPQNYFQNERNAAEIKWSFRTLDRLIKYVESHIPSNDRVFDPITWMAVEDLESILKKDFEDRKKSLTNLIQSIQSTKVTDWQKQEIL